MELTICQTCGIIVRGNPRRRCTACQGFISKHSPTPLSKFGLNESAPIGSVNFRADHLLLERVLEISQTEKLIWESPCKNGECIHEEGKVHYQHDEKESSDNGGMKKKIADSEIEDEDEKLEPDASEASAEIHDEDDEPQIISEKGELSSWTLSVSGIASDGLAKGIELAIEDVDAEPLPDTQSFSATTLVFGSAFDERVVTAEPQDLSHLYESIIEEQADKQKKDNIEKESKKNSVFDKVEETASKIFDQPNVGGSERDYAKALKDAIEPENSNDQEDKTSGDTGTGEDEWPDESYRRGLPKDASDSQSESSDKKSPYTSELDLSELKLPGRDSDQQFQKSKLMQSKGSFLGALMKVVVITVVFVLVGGVGLIFLGGSPTLTSSGEVQMNELGLPVLKGNWKIKMWVETPAGDASYGEISALMTQNRDQLTGEGVDGNGKFQITGSLGKADQILIAFHRQYDLSDGRQHPYPIRFKGVVGSDSGSNVVAQGSFANRLMQDMPSLNKRKFEQIQGYWSLTLESESIVDQIRKSIGI